MYNSVMNIDNGIDRNRSGKVQYCISLTCVMRAWGTSQDVGADWYMNLSRSREMHGNIEGFHLYKKGSVII